MIEVKIRGMGLSSALGMSLPACLEQMSLGRLNTVEIDLPGLSEGVQMPYYRIPDGAALFDPARFESLIAAAAGEALQAAGLSQAEISRLPVFVGSSAFSIATSEDLYRRSLGQDPEAALALPLVGFQHVATALQEAHQIRGQAFAFNTACTSSANALMCAARMIRLGWHRHALVMGVELANQTTLAGFSGLQLVARELRPFDARRSGIVLGEGVGAVLLSAAPAGQERGIFISGAATNCDVHSVTTANPDGSSIAALETELLGRCGLGPQEIRAVKSHGTASPANDTAEAAGLHRVFEPLPPVLAFKPFVGHTLGACGVNELALLGAALGAGFLPATAGFEQLDPLLNLEPLRRRLPAQAGHYMLNTFGFGGSNTALMIEHRP
jgi:3-oxoacyl-[acyl-carrier-protein] synthase-1